MISSATGPSAGRSASAADTGIASNGPGIVTILQITAAMRQEARPPGQQTAASMSRAHRLSNLAGVVLPFAGLVLAVIALWGTQWVGWADLAIMFVLYVLTGLGVT